MASHRMSLFRAVQSRVAHLPPRSLSPAFVSPLLLTSTTTATTTSFLCPPPSPHPHRAHRLLSTTTYNNPHIRHTPTARQASKRSPSSSSSSSPRHSSRSFSSSSSPSSSKLKSKPTQSPTNAPTQAPTSLPVPPKFESRTRGALSNVDVAKPIINWYPGHIAKAERALQDTIKMVDVVIEVRDARIPISTAHPSVAQWLGSRSRVIVLNRADLCSDRARSLWKQYYDLESQRNQLDSSIRFANAKQGRGVREVRKAAVGVGAQVNDKRKRKGLLPRPVRCLVMGFPNVGKSALINKLVGKNAAKSANKPGVTRNFQWIRISDDLELLDMPGIIPAKFVTQEQATKLAMCDDIGHAAYDAQIIAAALIDELKYVVQRYGKAFFNFEIMSQRFKVDPLAENLTGEDFLHEAAAKIAKDDLERTAVRLLNEFRAGTLGPVALEAPPSLDTKGEGE